MTCYKREIIIWPHVQHSTSKTAVGVTGNVITAKGNGQIDCEGRALMNCTQPGLRGFTFMTHSSLQFRQEVMSIYHICPNSAELGVSRLSVCHLEKQKMCDPRVYPGIGLHSFSESVRCCLVSFFGSVTHFLRLASMRNINCCKEGDGSVAEKIEMLAVRMVSAPQNDRLLPSLINQSYPPISSPIISCSGT